MNKIKENYLFCIHCETELKDTDLVKSEFCPNCNNSDFEECWTDEWSSLTDEERDEIIQEEEDNRWYNSVRLSH